MERKEEEAVYRMWVDTVRRVVSFHEVEGGTLMEFQNRELFLRCVDHYAGLRYRYQ